MMATVDGERDVVANAIEEICPSLRTVYPDGPDYTAPRVLAKAAIAALDAYRADAIRFAVQELIRQSVMYGRADKLLDEVGLGGEMGFEDARIDLVDAKHALLRLCGIEL